MSEEHGDVGGKWHMGKSINIGSLVGLLGLVIGQVYTYGELNQRIASMESTIITLKTDYVKKDVADQKLLVRDVHINKLNSEVILLRSEIKENQKILREILSNQTQN